MPTPLDAVLEAQGQGPMPSNYNAYDRPITDPLSIAQQTGVVQNTGPQVVAGISGVNWLVPFPGAPPGMIEEARAPGSDLLDSAIAARRGIEARRNQLIATAQGANRRQLPGITAALRGLDAQERGLQFDTTARMRQIHGNDALRLREAALQAHESDRAISHDRRSRIDEHASGAMNAMMQADQLLHSGQITKDQHDDMLASIPSRYPMALENASAAAHLRFSSELSDRQTAYQDRQRFRDAALTARKYGVPVQLDENGEPSIEATTRLAMQTPRGKAEQLQALNQTLFRQYGIPGGVGTIFNPVEPHVGTDEKGNQVDNPTHIQLPFADSKGQIQHLHIPMAQFNAIKAQFQQPFEEIAGGPVGAAPTAGGAAAAPATAAATVRVRNAQGQTGTIPAAQLQDALQSGYQQIQ